MLSRIANLFYMRTLFLWIGAIISLLIPQDAFAQFMTGYRPDRFSGVQTTFIQPAALAGNALRVDLQLGGVDALLWNSYLGLRRSTVRDGSLFELEEANPEVLPEILNGRAKQVYLGLDAHLPGISFRVNEKLGFGLYGRWRTLASLDNLGEPGARFSYYDREIPEQWGIAYNNDRLRFAFANFLEFGVGTGVQVWQTENHTLKAGANLKLNGGVFGTYFYAERLTYRFDNSDTLDLIDTKIETARSRLGGQPIPYNLPDLNSIGLPTPQFSSPGFGLDLGLLYEYRDSLSKARELPYKWRAGLAFTDIGFLRFERDDDLAQFEGQALDLPIGFWDPDGVQFFDSTLSNELGLTRDASDFRLALPFSVGFHGDYRFTKHWALQWDMRTGLYSANKANAFVPPFMATVVPRFEHKWFSVGVPFTVDGQNQFALGSVLRLGPLTVGSGNVLGYFVADNIRSVDVFAVLHVPIRYRPRKPKKSKEPKPAPEEEFPPMVSEVPTESDSTEEIIEEVVEIVEEEDTPKDPVEVEVTSPIEPQIQEVSEPEPSSEPVAIESTPNPMTVEPTPLPVAEVTYQPLDPVSPINPRYELLPPISLAQVAIDLQRTFPPLPSIDWTGLDKPEPPTPASTTPRIDVSQLTEEEIQQIEERETERRERSRQNPPASPKPVSAPVRTTKVKPTPYQSDRETLYDSGPYAKYMPFADPDKDGVPNQDDECPDLPGSPESRGCPEDDPRGKPSSERVPENPEVEAFERVYFDYDESYLNGKARVSLNRVARFLRENPETELEIWGHADANGSNPYNDGLSERRCKAVEAYLISKGIAADRLSILPLGERLPLASNATDEGREQNRRVELVLVDR